MIIRLLYKIAAAVPEYAPDTKNDSVSRVPKYTRFADSIEKRNGKPVNLPIEDDAVAWGEKTTIDQANTEGVAYPGLESVAWPIESAW